jgi:hypothetical protein
MRELRYTLVCDGSSDRALIPILTWLLKQLLPGILIQSQWADLRRLMPPPRQFIEKIEKSIEFYPCDLLFIHRDAERSSYENRRTEIVKALSQIDLHHPYVCVIPVRMTEAWLLIDDQAIRQAAGNPAGQQPLPLPLIRELESLPDPKRILSEMLRNASELRGRRLKKFAAADHAWKISMYIRDFSPLKNLAAFQQLEEELLVVLSKHLSLRS